MTKRLALLAAFLGALAVLPPGASALRTKTRRPNVRAFLLKEGRRRLKGPWKRYAPEISKTILAESRRGGMDPVFLMAMIANESSFNPAALGSHGEIGLMQIKPETAAWISRVKRLPYGGRKSLFDPVTNIRVGAAYVGYLKKLYGRNCKLYLAAYNMGCGSVRRALAGRGRLNAYPSRVLKHYASLNAELRSGNRRARA